MVDQKSKKKFQKKIKTLLFKKKSISKILDKIKKKIFEYPKINTVFALT